MMIIDDHCHGQYAYVIGANLCTISIHDQLNEI